MVNGVPSSSVVLPFSEKSLLPDQVSIENSPDSTSKLVEQNLHFLHQYIR